MSESGDAAFPFSEHWMPNPNQRPNPDVVLLNPRKVNMTMVGSEASNDVGVCRYCGGRIVYTTVRTGKEFFGPFWRTAWTHWKEDDERPTGVSCPTTIAAPIRPGELCGARYLGEGAYSYGFPMCHKPFGHERTEGDSSENLLHEAKVDTRALTDAPLRWA